ncbi:MAG TPA: hypothetical protein VEZ12_21770 [Herpetosiphonaceae bacterium]|nr:hypothetical protein [Herpetosiphonaceae bacterium]
MSTVENQLDNALRIGEIIESNTTRFVAGTYRLHETPQFGALVRAEGRDGCSAYGLVYNIETTSREMSGRALVRGRDGMFDQDIYAANPDLEAVLQTEFHVLIVGFCDGPVLRQHLPAFPPPVHYSVHLCDDGELHRFTERLQFCRTVLQAADVPHEELIAAALRLAARSKPNPHAFLVDAGRALAMLLREDHARLLAIIERIRP